METLTIEENLSEPTIFDFDNYKDYLSQICFPNGRYQHSKETLQYWSKKLGYKSPSSLAMVINGSRLPSREMVNALVKILELPDNEKLFLELQIDLVKCNKKGKDPTDILDRIAKVYPHNNHHQISLKEFSCISKWYFLVIKQLVETNDFKEDVQDIFKKLKKKITPSQIQFALDTMEDLGILGRNHFNKLIVLKPGLITTNDISSSAIVHHHQGMIQRSLESLEEDSVHDRQISSLTFKMPKKDLHRAKDKLFSFLKEFNSEFSTENCSDIYQLNVQLFSHTKSALEGEILQ